MGILETFLVTSRHFWGKFSRWMGRSESAKSKTPWYFCQSPPMSDQHFQWIYLYLTRESLQNGDSTLPHFCLWITHWRTLAEILRCFGLRRLRSTHPSWKFASETPRSHQKMFQKVPTFRSNFIILNGWILSWILHQIKIKIFLILLNNSCYKNSIILWLISYPKDGRVLRVALTLP